MTNNYPNLTVAIPTYKRLKSVISLVESIIPQLAEDDELLIVDDGSRDGTSEALSKIERVRLITNLSNEGMVKTWNKCLTSASQDWICIVHDDDTLSLEALAVIRKVCRLWNKPALIGPAYGGDGSDKCLRLRFVEAGSWAALNSFQIPSGVTVHKAIIETAGVFDEEFQYSPDLEYFSRICKDFPSIAVENPGILKFNLHEGNHEYNTWVKLDFFTQLEQIEKLKIDYAGLSGDQAEQYFKNKMNTYICYILRTLLTLSEAKDRTLLRKAANLVKDKQYLRKKFRFAASLVGSTDWLPDALLKTLLK